MTMIRCRRKQKLTLALLVACSSCIVFDSPVSCAVDASTPSHESVRVTPVVRAIRNVEPAVVNIQGNKTVAVSPSVSGGISSGKQEVNGMGTGVIIDARGYIITNLHVVQDVSRIEVTLADGTSTEAKMLNYDPDTDLALIKVAMDQSLPTIPMGSSRDLMRGEPVIAVGNPFGYQHSVTSGIISALHRNIPVNGSQEYRDLIQTNADINPGNSGGPLVNIEGKVIGINVAVRVGAQGIGFAIPIDAAKEVMADLVSATLPKDASTGFDVQTELSDQNSRVVIQRVSSQIANADFAEGDVIQSIDGRNIECRLDTQLALIGKRGGQSIEVVSAHEGDVQSKSLLLFHVDEQELSKQNVVEDAWERLGVRLVAVPKSAINGSAGSDKFSGGLKVVSVRPNSPASRERLERGDIIVGIMSWKTSSMEELSWIMKNGDFANNKSNFFVYRNKSLWTASLKVNSQQTR